MGEVTPFPVRGGVQAAFDRTELTRILDLYGRMVAAGHWRDYGIAMERDVATALLARGVGPQQVFRNW